jgi:hypothetical protein
MPKSVKIVCMIEIIFYNVFGAHFTQITNVFLLA